MNTLRFKITMVVLFIYLKVFTNRYKLYKSFAYTGREYTLLQANQYGILERIMNFIADGALSCVALKLGNLVINLDRNVTPGVLYHEIAYVVDRNAQIPDDVNEDIHNAKHSVRHVKRADKYAVDCIFQEIDPAKTVEVINDYLDALAEYKDSDVPWRIELISRYVKWKYKISVGRSSTYM